MELDGVYVFMKKNNNYCYSMHGPCVCQRQTDRQTETETARQRVRVCVCV